MGHAPLDHVGNPIDRQLAAEPVPVGGIVGSQDVAMASSGERAGIGPGKPGPGGHVAHPLHEHARGKFRQRFVARSRSHVAEIRGLRGAALRLGIGIRLADNPCVGRYRADRLGRHGIHQGHVLPGKGPNRVFPPLAALFALARATIAGLDLNAAQRQVLEEPLERLGGELLVLAARRASVINQLAAPRVDGIQIAMLLKVPNEAIARVALVVHAAVGVQADPTEQTHVLSSSHLA